MSKTQHEIARDALTARAINPHEGEPTLLATVPPMAWIGAIVHFESEWTTAFANVCASPAYPYFAPLVFWAEPIDGVIVQLFEIQQQPLLGPVPTMLFRLAMVDLKDAPMLSTMALGCPGFVNLTRTHVGEALDVQIGRAHV